MKRLSLSWWLLCAACAPTPEVPIEQTTFAASLGVDLSASTKLPSGMYIRDISQGMDPAATNGTTVLMKYTGWLANGTQFDSNQTSGFRFSLGAGEVIRGWDLGVPGMKTGGTRQLIIPPALGYGVSGTGPIPGNAVLIFNVTMVSTP